VTAGHERRVEALAHAYKEANARFMARLAGASADEAQRASADGGWSAAQIGWHVARVTDVFAEFVEGTRPSEPVKEAFTERPWPEIVAGIPARLEASRGVSPPAAVTRDDVLSSLSAAEAHLLAALEGLTAARGGGQTITHPAVGTVTLYQVGEWATAHVIRHNQQLKRVLGR
jgi:DinB superfamily